jgi:purine-binding chemotaxis protein CheW
MGIGAERPRAPVDWEEVRRRIGAAGRAIAGEFDHSPEHVRRVLQERARLLARPLAPPRPEDLLEVITFQAGAEWYAFETRYVLGVFRPTALAPLPGADPPVFALAAWRGEILTVLDLRAAGTSAAALQTDTRILVLGEDHEAFGVLADRAGGIMTLEPHEIVAQGPEAAEAVPLLGGTREAVLVIDARTLIHSHS